MGCKSNVKAFALQTSRSDDSKGISRMESGMSWNLSRPWKSQHEGALRSFKVRGLENGSICPVAFAED